MTCDKCVESDDQGHPSLAACLQYIEDKYQHPEPGYMTDAELGSIIDRIVEIERPLRRHINTSQAISR